MNIITPVFAFIIAVSYTKFTVASNRKRPLYNIAHMANSINELDRFLFEGANSVEADVRFSFDGVTDLIFHGYPCDAGRDCSIKAPIREYLSYVRDLTKPEVLRELKTGVNFFLLFLDLKTAKINPQKKYEAGKQFAEIIIKYLFEDGKTSSRIRLELSVNYANDANFVRAFNRELLDQNMLHLRERIGWDVGMNDNVDNIVKMWENLSREFELTNIWFGDGITNWVQHLRGRKRLREALQLRNSCQQRHKRWCVSKVYTWTVDVKAKIREALRMGVDAIMTNQPKAVLSVLAEPEFQNSYRLAKFSDNPWTPYMN